MKYKRIRSIDQYNAYCNEYEKLSITAYKKDAEVIDLLELLIEDYDNRTIEELGVYTDMNPVELLKSLMTENKLSNAELARQLSVSRQLITEIVNYKRNISKQMVIKLSDRFRMMPQVFAIHYDLIGASPQKATAST